MADTQGREECLQRRVRSKHLRADAGVQKSWSGKNVPASSLLALLSSLGIGGVEVGLEKEKARVTSPSFSAHVEPTLEGVRTLTSEPCFELSL